MSPAPPEAGAADPELDSIRVRAARDLRENVLPFWTRHTWDRDSGGFITHLDHRGRPTGVRDKYLVMQARMIWSLSAAHRHGIDDRGYLALAADGVEFLLSRMWDPRHAGFFWSVRADGRPLKTWKWLYGHAFAIYALAEYHLASGDAQGLERAARVFDLLQEKALDGALGYRERFDRRWRPRWRKRHSHKTLDAHMHLLEALLPLSRASGRQDHRRALREVMTIVLERTIHPEHGCGIDPFDRYWRLQTSQYDLALTTSYGHNAELAWLLLDAGAELGELRETLPVARRLVDHLLAYGFDAERGGVALYGPHCGAVTQARGLSGLRLTKSWWEQAETLAALVSLWGQTREEPYRTALVRHFDWVWSRQIDHEAGDWHRRLSWEGERLPPSDKGDEWKCAYHNARALMRTERDLSGLS